MENVYTTMDKARNQKNRSLYLGALHLLSKPVYLLRLIPFMLQPMSALVMLPLLQELVHSSSVYSVITLYNSVETHAANSEH